MADHRADIRMAVAELSGNCLRLQGTRRTALFRGLDDIVRRYPEYHDDEEFLVACCVDDKSVGTARYLLENGARVTDEAMRTTFSHRAYAVMTLLVGYGGDVNTWGIYRGGTMLNTAVLHDDVDAINWLLDMEADATQVDIGGNTVLHNARTVEQATRLLEAGADPTRCNYQGLTAMEYNRCVDVVAVLNEWVAQNKK